MAKAPAKKSVPVKTSFWQNDRMIGFVLAAFSLLLFANTIGFSFTLDDLAVIYKNNYVTSGFKGYHKILTTYYWNGCDAYSTANSGIFRPVSLLLFATEWKFAPGNPHFFHAVNLLLFAACVYHLYRLLRSLLRDYSVTLPFIAVALWVALPVHTEVNANIKSADEILALLFSVLAFRKLLNWSDSGKLLQLVYAALYTFAALLSKEGAVLMIPMMLLGLLMFRNKSVRELLVPGAAIFVVVLIWLGWHSWVIGNASSEMITYDYRNNALLSSGSRLTQLGTAIGMQARYWLKMIFGYPLSYNYSFNEIPVDGFASAWAWIALAGMAAAAYFTWKNFKTKPVISYSILFYFITFLLTSNIVYLIGDTFAERFTFVPSVGFTLLLSWLILEMTKGLEEKRFHPPALYIAIGLTFIYSIRTYARSQDWEYDSTLYTNDVEHSPNSARVHDNYGVLLLNNSREQKDEVQKRQLSDQAWLQFKASADIDSNDFQAALSLADIEYARGNYRAAIHWAKKDLKIFETFWKVPPTDKAVYFILANSYIQVQQPDSAAEVMQMAEKRFPTDDNVFLGYGNIAFAKKDTLGAIARYEKAVELNPSNVTAIDKIANLCGMTGQYEKSNTALNKIAALQPQNPAPYAIMTTNYLRLGDTAMAKQCSDKYRALGGR